MKNVSRLGLLAGLVLCLQCQPRPVYEAYYPVQGQAWHQDSALIFSFMIEDTTAWYQPHFNLRSNSAYPYSNIFLFREILSEDGLEFRDTAEYVMADAYGRWLGTGTGELRTFQWPFGRRGIQFAKPGEYRFKFVQAMRNEALPGIEQVGFTLIKKESNSNGKTQNRQD